MPSSSLLRALDAQRRAPDAPDVKIIDVELWLPSAIGRRLACDRALQENEWVFREAQANDALHTMRQNLRLDSYLVKKKKDWSRGVHQNTRSQTTIQRNLAKVKAAVEKYRKAHSALLVLEPLLGKPTRWAETLNVLADEDVRGMPVAGLGEGRARLSWIWLSPGVAGGEAEVPGLHDGMYSSYFRNTTYID